MELVLLDGTMVQCSMYIALYVLTVCSMFLIAAPSCARTHARTDDDHGLNFF
ncbi:MAG: hypothetical protein ACI90V_002462 [Bacillariaceae sp.]|jgi:hypothetical protein